MALFDRIRGLFGSAEDEPEYRCIQCGAGYERDYEECTTCGSRFVVAVGEGSDEPDRPDRLP